MEKILLKKVKHLPPTQPEELRLLPTIPTSNFAKRSIQPIANDFSKFPNFAHSGQTCSISNVFKNKKIHK